METEKKLAAMESDIKNMMGLLVDIKDELKGLNQTYIPRSEQNEMFKSRDEQIKEIKNEIKQIKEDQVKKKDRLPDWIAVGVAILAFFYSYYNK